MDATLHENGTVCPACEMRREREHRRFTGKIDVPCNNCGGTGRVSFTPEAVVRNSAQWARKHYWPERERRWRIQNERVEGV